VICVLAYTLSQALDGNGISGKSLSGEAKKL